MVLCMAELLGLAAGAASLGAGLAAVLVALPALVPLIFLAEARIFCRDKIRHAAAQTGELVRGVNILFGCRTNTVGCAVVLVGVSGYGCVLLVLTHRKLVDPAVRTGAYKHACACMHDAVLLITLAVAVCPDTSSPRSCCCSWRNACQRSACRSENQTGRSAFTCVHALLTMQRCKTEHGTASMPSHLFSEQPTSRNASV